MKTNDTIKKEKITDQKLEKVTGGYRQIPTVFREGDEDPSEEKIAQQKQTAKEIMDMVTDSAKKSKFM